MVEYKSVLGLLSVAIGFVAYAIYFRQMFTNRIRPHVFTWFIWGMDVGIAFAAQVAKSGGAGTWTTGVTALMCFVIAGLAYTRSKKDLSLYDWVSLLGTFAAVWLWVTVKDPTGSVIILCVINGFGAIPTLRKSYTYPHEESASAFALNSLKFLVGIAALESYSLATWLFPASTFLVNGAIIGLLLTRRNHCNPREVNG